MRLKCASTGSVLILVLWALAFLTVIAVQIGISVRQQATLVARLERRAALRRAAEGGIRYTQALLRKNLLGKKFPGDPQTKADLINNPALFRGIGLGSIVVDVVQPSGEVNRGTPGYGVSDEEGKINLNYADMWTLSRLFKEVLNVSSDKATDLARAVVEWRGGTQQLFGFYSQEYYNNLEFPYPPKHVPFERLEELILVQGFDETMFRRVRDFVTIYGPGRVNINTASSVVLTALGMSPRLRNKILEARRGKDGQEGTEDDFIFRGQIQPGRSVGHGVRFTDLETMEFTGLISRQVLCVYSDFIRIFSQARFAVNPEQKNVEIKSITSVFHLKDGKIIYWREE